MLGDRVNVRHTGKNRFTWWWKGEDLVYEVYLEGSDREERVLHKNVLLPYEFLPVTQRQHSQAGDRTWSTAKISAKAHRVSQISNDRKSGYSKIPTR